MYEIVTMKFTFYNTRNSGCYVTFFLAPAEGFGSPLGSQWWPLATTRGGPLGPPGGNCFKGKACIW